MADVALSIGGNRYTVSCRDGEEEHLRTIGSLVNAKTSEAKGAVGENIGEARQLLFAALLLADEVNELRSGNIDPNELEKIENLAERLTSLSEKLAPPTPSA